MTEAHARQDLNDAPASCRPVLPLKMPDITPAPVARLPRLAWLPLSLLVINDAYQRSLSDKSITSIRKMVANFDWARLKALTVVEMPGSVYEIIDGQHTAIAAASHGGILHLPCLVSPERSVQARAADFVGINRDRVAMTQMQVFWAEVTAEDEIAMEVLQGVAAAGGKVLRVPPAYGEFQVGDLMCIGTLRKLANLGGLAYVKRAVSLCVSGKLAPVKAVILGALPHLIWDGPLAGRMSDDEIISVLRVHGSDAIIDRARMVRREEKQSMSLTVASVILRLA